MIASGGRYDGKRPQVGGSLTIHGSRAFTTNFAAMVNTRTILAQAGHVDIQADLHQTTGARVAITQGGTVLLEGAATGGRSRSWLIPWRSGYGRAAPGSPLAAGQCATAIQFWATPAR